MTLEQECFWLVLAVGALVQLGCIFRLSRIPKSIYHDWRLMLTTRTKSEDGYREHGRQLRLMNRIISDDGHLENAPYNDYGEHQTAQSRKTWLRLFAFVSVIALVNLLFGPVVMAMTLFYGVIGFIVLACLTLAIALSGGFEA
ncbi:MAG: hypothetical protein P4L53_06425 [Candidatus Obscuribacterales bacterium]|nr:hypothetical protein [Candidatus Obscuribacterales bacterium]